MKNQGRNRTTIAVIGNKQSPCHGVRGPESRETLVEEASDFDWAELELDRCVKEKP